MTAKPKLTDANRALMRQARDAWALPHDEAKIERKQKIGKPAWTGTKQRNDLKTCPFCDTAAVQQVRLADNTTNMQFRIGCGNPCCLVKPNTPVYTALADAEWAWQDRADPEGE